MGCAAVVTQRHGHGAVLLEVFVAWQQLQGGGGGTAWVHWAEAGVKMSVPRPQSQRSRARASSARLLSCCCTACCARSAAPSRRCRIRAASASAAALLLLSCISASAACRTCATSAIFALTRSCTKTAHRHSHRAAHASQRSRMQSLHAMRAPCIIYMRRVFRPGHEQSRAFLRRSRNALSHSTGCGS